DVIKVGTPAGSKRVHRWPEGAAIADIALSREVMAAARAAGVAVVPELVAVPKTPTQPALRLGNRFYDAQEWMPSAPPSPAETSWPDADTIVDIPAVLPGAVFSAVIAAMARLHGTTTDIAARENIPTAPLSMLPGAVRQAHECHLRALRPRARHEPAIQRWLATGERLLAGAEPIVLDATHAQESPPSMVHLGLWPAHVILEHDALSGLLGWERTAAGSPLLDLAQATLRLQGWSDEVVEAAIATYADLRPLSPDERRLLPAVAALDAVASTGRLLEQTYAVDEAARPPTALRAGIDMMLRSMSALDRNLKAQASVGKSKRTPWRRGPRPTASRRESEGGKPHDRRR
ncbi:MAG: phosphotransferase, partial [Thermomicrobiales bacterium]